MLAASATAAAPRREAPEEPAGTGAGVQGTLTVAASRLRLAHVYALPRQGEGARGKGSVHLLLSAKALPVAGLGDVNDSGEVAAFLLEHEMQGIEAVVAADGTLLRVNLRHPELESMGMAMGVALLETPRLELTSLGPERIAGRIATLKPVTDGRLGGKAVEIDATFTAALKAR
jgi:hypothetical protein